VAKRNLNPKRNVKSKIEFFEIQDGFEDLDFYLIFLERISQGKGVNEGWV
jgi:hypothetical protein